MRCNSNATKGIITLVISLFMASSVLALPTITLTPKSQSVNAGQKANVRISTTGASKCTVTGGTYNGNNTLTNGTVLLSPTTSSTYTFKCTDVAGESVSTTTSVTVTGTTQTTNTVTPTQTTQSTPVTNSTLGNANNPNFGTAPQVQYGNSTIMNEANSICTAYSGYSSVYGTPSGGGGSSVPVDLTDLKPYLINIQQNTALTANEMRQADMIRFCRELPNMAAASNKLAQETAKQLKIMADSCVADKKCYLNRVYEADVQRELDNLSSFPIYSQEIKKVFVDLVVNNEVKKTTPNVSNVELCESLRAQGRNVPFCALVPTKAEIIKTEVIAARGRVEDGLREIEGEFYRDGVIASRPCTKTFSGTDPTNVFFKDKDCADYKVQPAIINQEILRQITSLPYTQAYSPANILGVDQSINNISTRVQNGNLIDPNISTGFGSTQSGGSSPTTGGGITNGTDMKSVEGNYNKILANIKVITTLYDVTKGAYASSTSVCKNIPVTSRNLTIQRIDSAKKTYTDYTTSLTTEWNKAIKTPNENHLNLVTQINFDLKDKYNQTLINQVYDASKSLLQAGVDTASGSTSSNSSTPSL